MWILPPPPPDQSTALVSLCGPQTSLQRWAPVALADCRLSWIFFWGGGRDPHWAKSTHTQAQPVFSFCKTIACSLMFQTPFSLCLWHWSQLDLKSTEEMEAVQWCVLRWTGGGGRVSHDPNLVKTLIEQCNGYSLYIDSVDDNHCVCFKKKLSCFSLANSKKGSLLTREVVNFPSLEIFSQAKLDRVFEGFLLQEGDWARWPFYLYLAFPLLFSR